MGLTLWSLTSIKWREDTSSVTIILIPTSENKDISPIMGNIL